MVDSGKCDQYNRAKNRRNGQEKAVFDRGCGMNIQSLRYFAAIAEGETVSRVAERFYISQPALSRSIQRLESELGCALFERSASALQLSRQGAAILPTVKKILCLCDDLGEIAGDYSDGAHSLLTIGCCGSESSVFYELVGLIRSHHPRMRMETPKMFSVTDMMRSLASREIDCCFAYSLYRYEEEAALSYLPLQPSRLQLIVPASHPLAREEAVPLRSLAQERFLLWRRDMLPGYHEFFSEGCLRCGFSPNVVSTFVSKQELFSKVAAGEGFGVIHNTESHFPENAPFAGVELLMDDGAPLYDGHVSLFWNPNNNNPALPVITELARECLAVETL